MGRKLAIAFISVGIIVMVGGLCWLIQTISFVKRAATAPGQITEMKVENDVDGTMYQAIFTFTDQTGKTHTQRSDITESNPSFQAGEKVTVLYDPANPEESKIDSFTTLWLFPVIFGGGGLVFAGFSGLWLFLWTRHSHLATFDNT